MKSFAFSLTYSSSELRFKRFQNHSVVKDALLAHVVPEGFPAIQHLVKDNACRPNIHFPVDALTFLIEGLRGQVPVSPRSSVRQSNLRVVIVDLLAESEVQDLHTSF